MRKITATTTQRNQVTIPAEVRRLLRLNPGDNVTFTIDDSGSVSLDAASFSLESAYGSVKPSQRPENFDLTSQMAKDAKAEEPCNSSLTRP